MRYNTRDKDSPYLLPPERMRYNRCFVCKDPQDTDFKYDSACGNLDKKTHQLVKPLPIYIMWGWFLNWTDPMGWW